MTSEAPAPVASGQDVTSIRIVAALIDIALCAVLFIVMAMIFGDSESGTGESDSGFSVSLNGAPFLLYLALVYGYFFACEWKLAGQTLGKKVMGVRVVALDGTLTPGKVVVRTILRLIDGLPIFYLVGFIAVISSKQKQRIGDMAAGTVVVRA